MKRPSKWAVFSQTLIALVLVSNLFAAVPFMLNPKSYMGGFELSGVPGEKAVAGMGILFLMWQVPYAFALINPVKHFVSLLEAVTMQTIGFLGESLLLSSIDSSHGVLRGSITRFIIFDGVGLALLITSWGVVFRILKNERAAREND